MERDRAGRAGAALRTADAAALAARRTPRRCRPSWPTSGSTRTCRCPGPTPPTTPAASSPDTARPAARAGTRLDCAIAENTTGRLVGSATLQLPARARPARRSQAPRSATGWPCRTGARATPPRPPGRWPGSAWATAWHRIRIRCEVPNAASAAVALRAGFGFEAISRASLPGRRRPTAGRRGVRPDRHRPGRAGRAGLAGARPSSATAWSSLRPTGPDDWPVLLAEANNDAARQWGFGAEPMPEADARQRGRPGRAGPAGERQQLAADLRRRHRRRGRHPGPAPVRAAGRGGHRLRGAPGVPRAAASPPGRCGCWRTGRSAGRRPSGWNWAARSATSPRPGRRWPPASSQEGRRAGRLRNPDGSYSDELVFGLVRPTG